ncbi:MAG: helix-turn-helix transcriptional regulator [Anaerolineales bacterium]|jgi:putative transcriptional regulator
MTVDNKVRERRQELGLTQEQLGEATKVTRQTIIALEKGGYTPSVELALKIARKLKTTVEDLFWVVE